MPFKPMPLRDFEEHLKKENWKLIKGKIDWNLYDETDSLVCSIKITHGKNTKNNEVVAHSAKRLRKNLRKGI